MSKGESPSVDPKFITEAQRQMDRLREMLGRQDQTLRDLDAIDRAAAEAGHIVHRLLWQPVKLRQEPRRIARMRRHLTA